MNNCDGRSPFGVIDAMVKSSALWVETLQQLGLVNDIYKAMESQDMADVVMTWLRIIKQYEIQSLQKSSPNLKCEGKSKEYRIRGNQRLALARYQAALVCYNKALLFAPENSREMVLAYSNRSALFYKLLKFSESLKDIKTCLALGCPDEIIEELLKRKHDCISQLQEEESFKAMFSSQDCDNYFLICGKRNPQIPCASESVGVIFDEGIPTIVASEAIKVGTVVAVEKAFVTSARRNRYFSCYYCLKMELNLFPCECCSYALFCSQECKDLCNNEYHKIESADVFGDNIYLKASIKMRQSCRSWEEFAIASKQVCGWNLASRTVKQMFDEKENFSLLCLDTHRSYFRFGELFNFGHTIALYILAIDDRTSFFPTKVAKKEMAIKAFARVMMKAMLFVPMLKFLPATVNQEKAEAGLHSFENSGLFSFAGKLKHDCDPNLLLVELDNRIALVAVRPIKCGDELTVSYANHWLVQPTADFRRKDLYFYNKFCSCPVCTEGWITSNCDEPLQSASHKKLWKRVECRKILNWLDAQKEIGMYRNFIFETLEKLSDARRSKEYCLLFNLMMRHLFACQISVTRNVLLSELTVDCVDHEYTFK